MHKFLSKFLRFLESTRKSSWGVLMKFWENCNKILKKFKRNWEENSKWFQENYGNIIGKNWGNLKLMLLILWKNFRKFFWNNFSEIEKKPQRNIRKTLKQYGKHFAQTFKNIFMETLLNFQSNSWKNLRKIVWKLQINLEENCRETPKKFWKYNRCPKTGAHFL